MPRPWVAVAATRLAPGRVSGWADSSEGVPSAYLDGLRRAGVAPAAIGPPVVAGDADEIAGMLAPWAGLVLCGGADVDPGLYGADAHPMVYGVDEVRDRFEILLVLGARRAGLPILAICRGIQILNVALGGTLIQHVPDLEGTGAHGVPLGAGVPARHGVDIVAGSRLSDALGGATHLESCVSIHHQAVGRIAEVLTVTGRSPDGMVEAVEPTDPAGWCVAVQWNPERSATVDPAQQAIFDGFAHAAHAHAQLPDALRTCIDGW